MKAKRFYSEIRFTLGRLFPGLVLLSLSRPADANPIGLTVQGGTATVSVNGSQFTINAGNNAQLNWQSFNIATGEKTIFNQPSASSIVWNRVNDPNPSQIFGTIQANGVVVLLNSSGFYFGPNSFVGAAGLVVSTANCLPPQNAGGAWVFNGPPVLKSIINYGTIQVGHGGSAFLIADQVENHGDISAPGGSIGFAAGQTVTLSERPDGRGMSMAVTLPQGSVDNVGRIVADAGTVALNAKVVNQGGFISANSVQNQNGVIELVAAESLNLGAGSQILAQGDDSSTGSAGGKVTLKSDNLFSDATGSRIVTTGGAHGGNGGDIEVSAPNITSLNSAMDARAQSGFTGGEFLLDPVNIILGNAGGGVVPNNGTVAYNSAPGTLNLNVNTAFLNKNFSNIRLQASGDITVSDNTAWDLSASTGMSGGQLTLQAGGNVVFNNGAQIVDANNWAVALTAGYDFLHSLVTPGAGSVLLNGNSSIQTSSGAIGLTAGKDITVGAGYVITTGGGGIDAHALTGSIDTGSSGQGYAFKLNASSILTAYDLSHGLGGISTMAGGDVNLTAGGNISSVLPGKKGFFYNGNFISAQNSDYSTAGAGAYGKQAGDVNIVAGGNVTGHYLVAKGNGSIFAGVQMDASGNPVTDLSGNYVLGTTGSAGTAQLSPNLALSLISGGWNVTAAQNIFLQEVRNPNGVFNVTGSSSVRHLFDYADGDYVKLTAGNAVQLGGTFSGLPRVDQLNVPMILPGNLDIKAGAGGVTLVGDSTFNQMILFPSPQGGLVINTTGGGSLIGKLPTSAGAPQIFNLIVSDSGSKQYKNGSSFGLNDHANTPVHQGHPTTLQLNISGDMNLLALIAPEAAQITVGGDMKNCRFQGMNLLDGDVTRITVGGDIINRGAFTSVDLSSVTGAAAPLLSYLSQSLDGSVSVAQLVNSFYYNPVSKILTYQNIPGVSLASVLQLLQNLTVQKLDRLGNPLWLDVDQTIPDSQVISVMNSATAAALLAKYNSLGAIPAGNLGYAIGGGGKFEINARNMDLGTTPGIQSKGVGFYRAPSGFPLANLFIHGADVDVHLGGNLVMYSSSIASLNGGNISIDAGGAVSVGSSDFSVTTTGARGIYTAGSGDVKVVAHDDINVNGSRIASYDGGNVTVRSANGNINAGTGGFGYVTLTAYYVDPLTRQVYTDNPTIPGSGILATTFPERNANYPAPEAKVGNILVETPNGNVNASAGGIVQLPLNKSKNPDATVTVLAGYELQNGTPALVLSAQNVVTDFTLANAGSRLLLVGSDGKPVLDAHGNPIHIAQLSNADPHKPKTSFTDNSSVSFGDLSKTLSERHQRLQLVGSGDQALKDSDGKSIYVTQVKDGSDVPTAVLGRNINVEGSGVIASNAKLKATGDIRGLIFARNNIDVVAQQNVNVTALGQGQVNVGAGGSVSGTIIGVGGVSASGSSIDAALLSQNISASGDTSGAKEGFAQGTAANAASVGASNEETTKVAKTSDTTEEDDAKRKKPVSIALAQKVSRVTVILPPAETKPAKL